MKKVTVTIKREQTYTIEFDENKLDSEFIRGWSENITDITKEPDEVYSDCLEAFGEENYPYLNLAKEVAYSVMVNDCDCTEGLRFQRVVDNDIITVLPDRKNYAVWYKKVGCPETEYEFDLDNTEL